MDNEEWRDIEGYEGIYQVSNHGRVKSETRWRANGTNGYIQKESILDQRFKHNRYGKVTLYKSGTKVDALVHRLVAAAFIPNPEKKPQINHKDNVSSNNNVNNLEWVTISENAKHAYLIGASTPPMLGKRHTEETKKKISRNRVGKSTSNRAFSKEQAAQIVQRKKQGEKRKKVYTDFKHLITPVGFENIWYGRAYKDIWREIK